MEATGPEPLAARLILIQRADSDKPRIIVPALAYTLIPAVSFREPAGELTSALVSMLLSYGFQLALNPDYTDILEQAAKAEGDCGMTVTKGGLVTLHVGGETVFPNSLTRRSQRTPSG